jgi:hypothetical protein
MSHGMYPWKRERRRRRRKKKKKKKRRKKKKKKKKKWWTVRTIWSLHFRLRALLLGNLGLHLGLFVLPLYLFLSAASVFFVDVCICSSTHAGIRNTITPTH